MSTRISNKLAHWATLPALAQGIKPRLFAPITAPKIYQGSKANRFYNAYTKLLQENDGCHHLDNVSQLRSTYGLELFGDDFNNDSNILDLGGIIEPNSAQDAFFCAMSMCNYSQEQYVQYLQYTHILLNRTIHQNNLEQLLGFSLPSNHKVPVHGYLVIMYHTKPNLTMYAKDCIYVDLSNNYLYYINQNKEQECVKMRALPNNVEDITELLNSDKMIDSIFKTTGKLLLDNQDKLSQYPYFNEHNFKTLICQKGSFGQWFDSMTPTHN